jgi:hypothetical protein
MKVNLLGSEHGVVVVVNEGIVTLEL